MPLSFFINEEKGNRKGWQSEVPKDRRWNGKGYSGKGVQNDGEKWSGVAWGINVGVVRKDPETASLFAF